MFGPPKMYCIYVLVFVVSMVGCLEALFFVLLCFILLDLGVSEREKEYKFKLVRRKGESRGM